MADKVEAHSFQVGKNTKQLDSLIPEMSKHKKLLLDLRAKFDRRQSRDDVLRDLVTDSDSCETRHRRVPSMMTNNVNSKRQPPK